MKRKWNIKYLDKLSVCYTTVLPGALEYYLDMLKKSRNKQIVLLVLYLLIL